MKNINKIQKISFFTLVISIISVIVIEQLNFNNVILIEISKKIQFGIIILLIIVNVAFYTWKKFIKTDTF